MGASRCVNELARNANSSTSFSDAAFENVADAEFSACLLYVNRLSLVREARVAGDNEQRFEPRQRGDDLLNDPIGEILLLGIARHVLEGQHGNRGFVRQRKRVGRLSGLCIRFHTYFRSAEPGGVDANGTINIL